MAAELLATKVPGVPTFEPAAMRKWMIATASWTTAVAICFVLLRLLSRHIRKQRLWWDDQLLLISMVSCMMAHSMTRWDMLTYQMWSWIVLGLGSIMYLEGLGFHANTLSERQIENIVKWQLISGVFYLWNLCWTKLSLLLMYYRIFHIHSFKKQTTVVGAIVIVCTLMSSFLTTFRCIPVQKTWMPQVQGRCTNELGAWLAINSCTVLTDVMILVLPTPLVWRLHLKKGDKVGLTLIFGLGVL